MVRDTRVRNDLGAGQLRVRLADGRRPLAAEHREPGYPGGPDVIEIRLMSEGGVHRISHRVIRFARAAPTPLAGFRNEFVEASCLCGWSVRAWPAQQASDCFADHLVYVAARMTTSSPA
jgi:hypothetical protein